MKLVLFWQDGRVRAGRLNKNDIVVLQTADCDLDRHGLAALIDCLLYTSPSPRDKRQSRMPSSA